jgi:hypothetical protein
MNAQGLLRLSIWVLLFALSLFLIGQLLAPFPLGQVTGTENMGAWLGVIAAGVVAAALLANAGYRVGATWLAQQPAQSAQPARPTARPTATSGRVTYNAEAMR